jgi:hypothetical protein
MFIVYHVKTHENEYRQYKSDYRVWFHIEIYWFFSTIWACILYLMIAYTLKTNSLNKSEALLQLDDDIWNDKDTDDFVRY